MICPLLCIAWNIEPDNNLRDNLRIECMKEKCGWWCIGWHRCGMASNG